MRAVVLFVVGRWGLSQAIMPVLRGGRTFIVESDTILARCMARRPELFEAVAFQAGVEAIWWNGRRNAIFLVRLWSVGV